MTAELNRTAYPKFSLWLLTENLAPLASSNPGTAKAVADMTALFSEWVSNDATPPDALLKATVDAAQAAACGNTGASGPPAFAAASAYALGNMMPTEALWAFAQAAGSAEVPDITSYHLAASHLVNALLPSQKL